MTWFQRYEAMQVRKVGNPLIVALVVAVAWLTFPVWAAILVTAIALVLFSGARWYLHGR